MINIKIFVSSTFEDLKDFRKEINELINGWGLINVVMERFPAHPSPPQEIIKKAIEESDIFIGIYAWRYGSKMKNKKISYTEYEYELAKDKGLPMLIFQTYDNMNWNINLVDINRGYIDKLRNKVKEQRTIKYFGDKIELIRHISSALFYYLYKPERFDKINETQKSVLKYRQHIIDDFIARRDEIEFQRSEDRNWFINEIQRCNVGSKYIYRNETRQEIADWLFKNESPFFFLTGAAGIGKTNFLLTELTYSLLLTKEQAISGFQKQELVIFLPLGGYDIKKSFVDNAEHYINQKYINENIVEKNILTELIYSGKAILILDGLDEFIRVKGESVFHDFIYSLNEIIDINKSKIIISCRDHIFNRLKNKDIFNELNLVKTSMSKLSDEEVIRAFRYRLGERHPGYFAIMNKEKLRAFAKIPLLLELMARISIESWKKLIQNPNEASLYDMWFEEIITSNANPDEILNYESIDITRNKLGNIACTMLHKRTDLISATEINISELLPLTKKPFGILIQQTPDEWGFIHDSFREFAIAKTISTEFIKEEYNQLIKTSSFDYVGAETYSYFNDLIYNNDNFYEYIEKALKTKISNNEESNNLIRNCFEAIGMIGQNDSNKFIDIGINFLCKDEKINYKTKYNIVRCLERIHPSAPNPYYKFAMGDAWQIKPNWNNFFVYAIRGFHLKQSMPGFGPFLYNFDKNNSDSIKQFEVSTCFVTILEDRIQKQVEEPEYLFLEYNISMALIRWLHRDHINRLMKLLPNLKPESKGNLFHSLLLFKNPELFDNCSKLFEGMELNRISLNKKMLPDNFIFYEVTFKDSNKSKFEGFSDSQFYNCIM